MPNEYHCPLGVHAQASNLQHQTVVERLQQRSGDGSMGRLQESTGMCVFGGSPIMLLAILTRFSIILVVQKIYFEAISCSLKAYLDKTVCVRMCVRERFCQWCVFPLHNIHSK